MTRGTDPISRAVYRSVLKYARRFDQNIAAKALIQQSEAVQPPQRDWEEPRDRRLFAAGLAVVVGSPNHILPERLTWSLQRLIRTLRRAEQSNTTASVQRMEDPDSGVGLPLDEKLGVQQDAMLAMTLDVFFPSAADAVEGQDKINAGFAALRELSSKWALAESLGLTGTEHPRTPRRRRKLPRAGRKISHKEMRAVRHTLRRQERFASEGDKSRRSPRGSGSQPHLDGVVIEPTSRPAKGVFLISHPLAGLHAPDNIFHRSVVLLVHHDEGGSYGLVLNKDKGQTLQDVVSMDAVPLASDALQHVLSNPVRVGGPVLSRLAWLHHHEEVGGVKLSEDTDNPVFFCGTMDKASKLMGEGVAKPTDFNLLVGASSWAGGQLRDEVDRGMWVMAKAPASLALYGGKHLWREMLKAMGGPYAEMARVPHGHRWADLGAISSPSDWA